MRIQHNIIAMNAYRNYNNNTSAISKNLEKLSSGYKINRAGDDAAGLAVSQKMRLQIAGLAQAQKNAKSGISYIQTAEGSLQEVHEMLERMYTLAEQSANGTFDDTTDRTQLQKEVNSLMEEINRIGKTANFNGMGIFAEYEGGGSAVTAEEATEGKTDAKAAYEYDFTDVTLKKGEKLKVTIAGVSKTIEADADLDAAGVAGKVKDAFNNAIGPDDGTGKFGATVTNTSKVTLTATNNSADANKATMMQASMAPVSDGSISFWVGAENIGANKLTLKAMNLAVGSIQIGDSYNGVGVNVDANVKPGNIAQIDITDANTAMTALTTIKQASDSVSNMRGTLGAMQNRLDHTIKNLSVMQENMQDAESVIRDTDVAEEMMAYTKNNILVQSAQAMLAQANQIPQGVLQLLQ